MKRGFTLIELIFVIVIIGLLASVAVPRFLTVEQNAKLKPAIEVAKQVVNKCVERYELMQDASVQDAVNSDPKLQEYLKNLTTSIDKHFWWDTNETVFVIEYRPNKKYYGNKDNSGNELDTHNSVIQNLPGSALCVKVSRFTVQVPMSNDANATAYDFNISEINMSCMTAAE